MFEIWVFSDCRLLVQEKKYGLLRGKSSNTPLILPLGSRQVLYNRHSAQRGPAIEGGRQKERPSKTETDRICGEADGAENILGLLKGMVKLFSQQVAHSGYHTRRARF
jgi:hypothetical protein